MPLSKENYAMISVSDTGKITATTLDGKNITKENQNRWN